MTYHVQDVQDSLETLLCKDFWISKKSNKQVHQKKNQQTTKLSKLCQKSSFKA